jgi:hypothetical protein
MESRIPALDALETFVPNGAEHDTELENVRARTGFSRWYPTKGGHRVLILYEGGEYDRSRFSVTKGGWDHEHCKRCNVTIESMTRCWVTTDEPYILLCDGCHGLVVKS